MLTLYIIKSKEKEFLSKLVHLDNSRIEFKHLNMYSYGEFQFRCNRKSIIYLHIGFLTC